MFHSQGQKSTGTATGWVAPWSASERALVLETKHLWEHTLISPVWKYPVTARGKPFLASAANVRAGPARRRPPATATWHGRRRGRGAPCRSWCKGKAARRARISAPLGGSRRRPPEA